MNWKDTDNAAPSDGVLVFQAGSDSSRVIKNGMSVCGVGFRMAVAGEDVDVNGEWFMTTIAVRMFPGSTVWRVGTDGRIIEIALYENS